MTKVSAYHTSTDNLEQLRIADYLDSGKALGQVGRSNRFRGVVD